ncbi:hypothetical protein Sme01_55380 [Sphaerisporangium melleum]|uniref:TIR domain-containing protein n=1 Tax=Sphaerisporangium melleum TaxID=321316 RepID=A0A917RSF7_9ACTN|nr:toll/interleukin-1 receptor domain-containing protein [Sphaerisporangium melleum]GGL20529.1 hypothetical protein GCM10007964_73090 [Sphaerisporangium melleum]GII73062.1 hypothetical protein Sme01_55380 [Sphaerisporangium melleum]
MHEVFINYRTGDGDEAANLIDKVLSDRFGDDNVFLAAKSMTPGQPFPRELLRAVRCSSVLLAVIGPNWSLDPRLHGEKDWVRREILEAYELGIHVIPILKGRTTERLKAADLPPELEFLTEAHYLRLDTRDNRADLARIGDELARLVPALKEADMQAAKENDRPAEPGTTTNTARDVYGPSVQAGEVAGDAGNIVKNIHHSDIRDVYGSVNTGKGESHNFFGDGATYFKGDNYGGNNHRFRSPQQDEDDS